MRPNHFLYSVLTPRASCNCLPETTGSYFGDLLIKDNLSNFIVPDAFTDGIAIHHTASSEKANPEFFWMVDVTFVSDNVKNKTPSICFFIDQIVAVTIGVLE